METAFCGFNIPQHMTQTVVFFFARHSPLAVPGNIEFDDIILDSDSAWDAEDKAYITKTPGQCTCCSTMTFNIRLLCVLNLSYCLKSGGGLQTRRHQKD
jgi:hypothetical protein